MKRVIINPVTRISGFLEIDAIIEDNIVREAKTEGLFFRGFEQILKGRNPFDAVYFTQRICGICSTAHSMASTLALEKALNIVPSEQGKYLRDIIHGCEFLQNHIRHFYQYTIPDYVKMPEEYNFLNNGNVDFRIPEPKNKELVKHYFESISISRGAHEMLAVLGGKAPHNHGVFIGGITAQATVDKILKLNSILTKTNHFITNVMIPDVYTIAHYYSDYYKLGEGYKNLLSFGCFDNYQEIGNLYVSPLVYTNGEITKFDPDQITEQIDYSRYEDRMESYKPLETLPKPQREKAHAYSWIKAPRYNNLPYEVGPLARLWLTGEYRRGISAMDRTVARVLEAKKIAQILKILLENLNPGILTQDKYQVPERAIGVGLIDTTRGALGHWLKIDKQRISFYQIITPSAWNLSTRSNEILRGTAEEALMYTPIKNIENPVELGRIIRSFDPCISCATHVYVHGKHKATLQVNL